MILQALTQYYERKSVADEGTAVLAGDLHDRLHVTREPPHVHGDNSPRPRARRGLDRRRVDGNGVVDVDDYGYGASGQNRRVGYRRVSCKRN